MKPTIHLSDEQCSQLLAHADNHFPQEAVALLFGKDSENEVVVKHVALLNNESENKRISFSVNPEVQYRLLVDADTHGEIMVGIFHSHPAPPRPSLSDLKNMRLNQVVWIIASKTTGEWILKAFVLENDIPIEISINPIIQTNA